MSQFVGKGKRIGFPIFELDTFSEVEKHHLSYLDKVFVCSEWAKKVVEHNIDHKDVSVIPLGIDDTIFKPSPINDTKTTIFFNCGKWEIRKGHDVLVQMFNEAFTANDNVQLWLMCSNPFLSEEETTKWQNLYYSSKLGSKIRIIPRLNTQKEVYNIISKIDCGVFPSRAEGWNLELLELMSCGKPVITTNYSAHTEFCNKENSYLVDTTDIEPAYDGKWFFKQGNWAKIGPKEIEQFASYMRLIHDQKQSGSLSINNAGIQTGANFKWANTAEKIIQHV
jgi:glycosyltransferase involved in cell wall biosynthesis